MRTGVCPKCSGRDIYATRGGQHIENSPINDRHLLAIRLYVCSGCGYIEQYMQNWADMGKLPEKKLLQKINSAN